MYRTVWALFAAICVAVSTGCSMCDACFDYTYPAYGGRYCWEADDCCRAGSAFCHVAAGMPYDSHVVEEIHDPVPETPYVPDPEPTQEAPLLPPPSGSELPDLTPPSIPDTGVPPVEELELPPLRPLN